MFIDFEIFLASHTYIDFCGLKSFVKYMYRGRKEFSWAFIFWLILRGSIRFWALVVTPEICLLYMISICSVLKQKDRFPDGQTKPYLFEWCVYLYAFYLSFKVTLNFFSFWCFPLNYNGFLDRNTGYCFKWKYV